MTIHCAIYRGNGTLKTVQLAGTEAGGMVSARIDGGMREKHDLIGADTSSNVAFGADYVADARGVVRMASGQDREAVSGTSSFGLALPPEKWTV